MNSKNPRTAPFRNGVKQGHDALVRLVERILTAPRAAPDGDSTALACPGEALRSRKRENVPVDQIVAFSESCAPGWDGYDASSASYDSYLRAKRFIEALPANFPAPEVAVDPGGEVSLEWYCPTGHVFSVSIGANDGLTYAGKFSPSRMTDGTEVFTSQIPQVILDNIRRVMA